MKKFICKKEIELHTIVKEVLEKAENSGRVGAFVVALYGELGAGKTTFTKHFARELGITKEITSPTFVIQKRFEIAEDKNKIFKNFYHLDVYRIDSAEEIESLGWKEIISDPKNIVLVEWADKIENKLPKNALKIKFVFVNDTTREVQVFE